MRVAQGLAIIGFVSLVGAAHAATTTSISFDTFCDGLDITIGSHKISADFATGCNSGFGAGQVLKADPLNTGTKSDWVVLGENFPGRAGQTDFIQYPLVKGGTWVSYLTKNGTNVHISSGTYSLGAPTAAAVKRNRLAHFEQ